MPISKEAKALVEAQVNSNEIASKELNRILKESKNVEKKLNKEYRSIASKSLLKQRLVQLYVSGFYNDKQIASILMVSPTTIKRLLKDNDVIDMIMMYQDEEKKLIDSKIKALRNKATETMFELLDSDDDSIRLATSKDILDRSGHAVKKDVSVDVNISYEQQLQELAQGIDFEIVEVE